MSSVWTDNFRFVKRVQEWMGIYKDGHAGPITRSAFDARIKAQSSPFPKDNEEDITDFFGDRGSNLVRMELPYPMRLAWNHSQTVTSQFVNEKASDALHRILSDILDHYGSHRAVKDHRMDLLGGIFNNRRMRNSGRWSRHAWGIAIDLDPKQNGLKTPWPEEATMPIRVVEIFERHGWKSGARHWGVDAMHFQATQ